MPLNILLPMVVLGIAGLVLLVRLLRPTPPLTLANRKAARALWDHRNPENPARAIHLSRSRNAALIETDTAAGLLWSMGCDPVTRLFHTAPDCHETDKTLIVRTGDFTAPKITIALPDPTERRRWRSVLEYQV